MTLQIFGQTTHFIVRYDDAVGVPAQVVANAVLNQCEADLARLAVYMPYMRGGGGDPFLHPTIDIQILNDPLNAPGFSSADNNGHFPGRQSRMRINPFSAPGVTITFDFAGFLFVAEMSEILMGFYGWDAGSSQGEALSRVMAEELHPASSANFVNTWLGWPRPRPDWINRNEPMANGLLPRGDLDPIAYGCGIILIYFLRYQLKITYDQICGAGGTLLSDRYHTLTGAGDDPAVRVSQLLDSHFGTGPINLVGNNPFPLYDPADRRVLLAFAKPTAVALNLPESGHAHVRPFFNCPAADYPYTTRGAHVTQTITATTLGLGFPSFTWRVNGLALVGSSQINATVNAAVDVPDPQNPDQPKRQTQPFAFDYQIANAFTVAGGSSTLTLTSRSLDGDFQVDVEADAEETAAPGSPVSARQGLTFHTRSIVYGGTYSADQQRCEQAFEKETRGKLRVIQASIDYLHDGPYPPPDDYLTRVLEAAERIREEVAQLAATDHALATQVARYAAGRVGVPPQVFLKGARGGSGTAA